jgi:glycosyltransferase involved in cell wall biosynthesis
MNNDLTIVIPCKNEGTNITEVLRLISFQKIDCKIVIADSTDKESDLLVLKSYVKKSPQTITLVDGGLPSIARNNGAKLVKTPYVLFLDADMFLYDANSLKDCLTIAKNNDLDLVTCHIRTTNGNYNWPYKILSTLQIAMSRVHPIAIGGFMLFKTDTYNKLGGFDEQDKIAEDYHLSSKINPRKFKFVNRVVYTTDRRFKKKGVWYMIKLAWNSFVNRNNPDFFKNDYGYWS